MVIHKKTVAVLCSAFNGVRFIEEQVKSILLQENVDVSIYLSVDVSSDGTHEFCSQLVKKYGNITMLPYGEKFGGAAKNFYRLIHDVDFTQYDYIALSDQDDVWMKHKLARAIECIELSDFDAYSSDVIAFWDDGRKRLVKKSYPQTKYDYFFESAGPGCTYVFREAALQKFKVFMDECDNGVGHVELHDWMIYAFFRSRDMKWYIDNLPSMLYRQHTSNQFGSNTGVMPLLKRICMVRDKWYRTEVEKIYALLATDITKLKLNRCFLLGNFWELRRRLRDKLVLFVFILFGLF